MPPATQLPTRGPQGPTTGGPARRAASRLLWTRRGAVVIATVAGLAALAVILAFMASYRDSVKNGTEPERVLVAARQLDRGTPGNAIVEAGLLRTIVVHGDEADAGAFTRVDDLRGKHTTRAIAGGEQLTAGDFAAGTAKGVVGKLTGIQRALSVAVDAAHGNLGQVQPGSKVDVLGGFDAEVSGGQARPVLDVLARDVLVLSAPEKPSGSGIGGGGEEDVVLRLTDREAARVAFAADHGKVWLAIRPPTLAKDSQFATVQAGSMLGLGGGGGR